MKKEFSTHWESSTQPRKQRKYRANAPLHIKRKFVSINLSKELRAKYKKRNLPARKGDVVRIMRGKFKKKQGKILEVITKKSKVIVDGIQVKKQDGSKASIKLEPSNMMIIELILEDKMRRKKIGEKEEKKTETDKNPNNSKSSGIFKVPIGTNEKNVANPIETNKNENAQIKKQVKKTGEKK